MKKKHKNYPTVTNPDLSSVQNKSSHAYLEELKNHVVEMRRNVGYLDWLELVLCYRKTNSRYESKQAALRNKPKHAFVIYCKALQ